MHQAEGNLQLNFLIVWLKFRYHFRNEAAEGTTVTSLVLCFQKGVAGYCSKATAPFCKSSVFCSNASSSMFDEDYCTNMLTSLTLLKWGK